MSQREMLQCVEMSSAAGRTQHNSACPGTGMGESLPCSEAGQMQERPEGQRVSAANIL